MSTNDTGEAAEVYVTFGAKNPKNKACSSPAGLSDFPFLQKVGAGNLQGKFSLGANQTQDFDSKGKCLSGNVCFLELPKCGTNIAEFTLNPASGFDEVIDISCVNGINVSLEISVTGGWFYGPHQTPIREIRNSALEHNCGNPGIYPVNCTTCTGAVKPPCPELPTGPCQSEAICNVSRTSRGGTVEVKLLSQS